MSISRRTALATTAAAVVTGAITAPIAIEAAGVKAALAGDPVVSPNDSDLLALEQEWANLRYYINNYPDESDEALDPLYERLTEREEAIFCCPARTPAGLAIKLRLWDHYYNSFGESWP